MSQRDPRGLVGVAAKRIVTADPARITPDNPLGVLEDAVVVYDEHSISWIGPRASAAKVPIIDHGDRVITPGLVDAHTHAAWVGSRHDEYAMRMAGADYRAIAAAGGGILSSFRAIEARGCRSRPWVQQGLCSLESTPRPGRCQPWPGCARTRRMPQVADLRHLSRTMVREGGVAPSPTGDSPEISFWVMRMASLPGRPALRRGPGRPSGISLASVLVPQERRGDLAMVS